MVTVRLDLPVVTGESHNEFLFQQSITGYPEARFLRSILDRPISRRISLDERIWNNPPTSRLPCSIGLISARTTAKKKQFELIHREEPQMARKRPTVADVRANKGKYQYTMI